MTFDIAIRVNVIYATVVVLIFTASAGGAAAPNILLITSEDNGPELSCYGDPFVRTPNLDRLASEGMHFERAFVATASCSESRAALLTGLYPHQNGQIGLANLYRMFGELPNMFSHLRANGYRTGLIGKLHINPESAFPIDYRPPVSDCNTFSERDVYKVAKLAEEFFLAEDAPFFLMVNFSDAHLPYLRQENGSPAKPLSGSEVRPLPWIGLDTPKLRACQADYYNCIMRLDDGIGHLLAALKQAGLSRNTLVLYLGDHGAQFPRGKLCSYESSLQIPLIVRWPNHVPAGRAFDELVATVDILPTVLEAASIQIPANLPGRSLIPFLLGQNGKWRQYLFTEYHGHMPDIFFPQRTVRDDRFKLIMNLLQDRPSPVAAAYCESDNPPYPSYVTPVDVATGNEEVQLAYATWREAPPVELYDLENDPYERCNRADDPELAKAKARLLAALAAWRSRTADPLVDEKKLDKLTMENDAAARECNRPKAHRWQYLDYLSPSEPQSIRKCPPAKNGKVSSRKGLGKETTCVDD